MNPSGTHPLRVFNPYEDIRQTQNRLPHWQQVGATYFVTVHLVDSVPSKVLREWESDRKTWLQHHPPPWIPKIETEYHERFSGARERWLDAGHGSCLLRQPDCARIVADALLHFDGIRLVMISLVVMPNHVHTLFVQEPSWPLEKLMYSWKRYTSGKINKRVGRSGPLWQKDYFDRLVRDQKHFANCVRYIRRNPEKARLREGQYILYENEVAQRIL